MDIYSKVPDFKLFIKIYILYNIINGFVRFENSGSKELSSRSCKNVALNLCIVTSFLLKFLQKKKSLFFVVLLKLLYINGEKKNKKKNQKNGEIE